MKKISLIAAGMLLTGTAMAADFNGYWYIRGEFNGYNPDGQDKWALFDDGADDAEGTSGNPGVYVGTFTVPAGEFKFNLMNGEGLVFVPIDEDFDYTNVNVKFVDNSYSGVSGAAWDDYDESYYWIDETWGGGMITVWVNANGNNPTVEIYAYPAQTDIKGDYTASYSEDQITITWTDAIQVVCKESEGAYLQSGTGRIALTNQRFNSELGEYEGNIKTNYDDEAYVVLSGLELAAGDYTLVIPEGYFEVWTGDWDNIEEGVSAAIEYKFTISKPSSIDKIEMTDGEVTIYTLQGVKVNSSELKNLRKGVYIINGKKVVLK